MPKPRPALIFRLEDRSIDLVISSDETLYNALLTLAAERDRLNLTRTGEIRYTYGPQTAAMAVSYKSGFTVEHAF